MIGDDVNYSYLPIPNELKQKIDITASSPGTVKSIGISTGGDNYRVNDDVVLDNTGTGGEGFIGKVSHLQVDLLLV